MMTARPRGAAGVIQNTRPVARSAFVQMNWLVTTRVAAGSATHAGTPVRSAWTRKPVTSGQDRWPNCKTIIRPAERAASVATAPGSAASVLGPLLSLAGSLLFVLVRVCGATASPARASATATGAATAPARTGTAATTPSTMTSSVMTGPDQ